MEFPRVLKKIQFGNSSGQLKKRSGISRGHMREISMDFDFWSWNIQGRGVTQFCGIYRG